MEKVDYKKLRNEAIAYARIRGHATIAEDFAQEFLIETLKGRKAKLGFIFIDFLRKEYGDTGAGRSIAGRNKSFASLSFQQIRDNTENENERSFKPSESYVRACIDYDRGYADNEGSDRENIKLPGRDGLIIDRLLSGESLKSIGISLGVTESRVSQLATVAKRKISNQITFREKFEEYKLFPEKSMLAITWIRL